MIDSLYEIVNQIKDPETMTFGTFMAINGVLGLGTLIGYGLCNLFKNGNSDVNEVLRDYDRYNPIKDDLAKRIIEKLEKLE